MTLVIALRRGGSRRAFMMLVVILVGLAGTFWAVYSSGSLGFLEERARFQSYDSERFGAQALGLRLAEENPIGIGPGQFELVAPLSAHSTYVRALAEEGVLGAGRRCSGVMLGTLLLAAPQRRARARHVRDRLGPLLAAWCGMLVNSFVIDTLHWRHLWLLAGLIWAGTAAEGVRSQLSSRVGRAAVR